MDLSSIRAITFDCYGTLIDWEAGILRALRPLLGVHGVTAPDADILALYASLEAPLEQGEYRPYREVLEGVVRGFAAHYAFRVEDRELDRLADSVRRWEAFPDTVPSLQRLAESFQIVICSNIDDDLFEHTRPRLGIEPDRVVTAQYCRSYKPDPRHFRVAHALLGLEPREVLHAAQSRYHDIAPARALGIPTAWINRPSARRATGATPPPPPDSEPDLVTENLTQLCALMGA